MKIKVYTLTGDSGTTALVGGTRVDKDNVRVEAYGTIDELNANIGLLARSSNINDPQMVRLLKKVQNKLFNIGAYLATPNTGGEVDIKGVDDEDVKELERQIDIMDLHLPPLEGFVLPGGSRVSAQCDICRTVTRRAERRVVTLAKESVVAPIVLKYLNRLSDFFFVFARFTNITNQVSEHYWDRDA